MYGTMYGIVKRKKTTIYLPHDLKKGVEEMAKQNRLSEATVIRDAIASMLSDRRPPEPRLPLGDFRLGAPDVAERVDELLDEGFGR